MLFIATGLSFLDRQVLSMTIIKIQSEFGFSNVQYGFVNTAFLISYALMFTIGGRLIDSMGSKKGMALAVLIWSIANTLHGIMANFYQLLAFRFLLGAGEGGCFPGAAKTVYTWFSEQRRALANGIAIGGSAIGAVIAPPLTTVISTRWGWRWSFVIPGLIGLAWVIIWLSIRWNKDDKKTPVPSEDSRQEGNSFLSILKSRETGIFILIRFMLDPVVYFIMFWAPKYLHEQRHISFEKIGQLF
ncbi:MAG TPA: MFS transporter, partial [Puia sp.]|nr:MFS transporter [Puia sp.]